VRFQFNKYNPNDDNKMALIALIFIAGIFVALMLVR
jgi:hypothetical protein